MYIRTQTSSSVLRSLFKVWLVTWDGPDDISANLYKHICIWTQILLKKANKKLNHRQTIAYWPRLCFSQCLPPLILSTRTVNLHATKARSNVIGQYDSGYKRTTNGNQTDSLPESCPVADRFCIHMQISVYRDFTQPDRPRWGPNTALQTALRA